MITYVPFEPAHLDTIIANTREKETWLLLGARVSALDNGFGVTGLVDGMPIGAGGLLPFWDGVAEGWLALTPTATKHGVAVTRYVIRYLRYMAAEMHIRRLQAHVDSTFTIAWQWLERMGFQRESELPRYGPHGQTYYMYVWYPSV